MLNRVISALILVPAISFMCFAADAPDSDKSLKQFMDDFSKAYSSRDVDAVMKLFSSKPEVVSLSSDEKARDMGQTEIRESFKRDLDSVKSVKLDYAWMSTGSKGEVGWFASEVNLEVDTGEDQFKLTALWSGVLEKEEGAWKVIVSHFSLRDPLN